MATDRFLIAPYDSKSGLQRNVKPFFITDEAFASLNNAYAWRGRIRKRFGSRWFGNTQQETRLRFDVSEYSIALSGGAGVGITNGGGDASGTVPGGVYQLGQKFIIGAETDTVSSALAGAQPMTSTGPSTTHTFNIGTGAYNFVGAPIDTQIYFFPNVATTSVGGAATGLVPTPVTIGQMFSIGSSIFTINALGNAASMLISGTGTTAIINTNTGAFSFTGVTASEAIYFYPALPVMGLATFQNNTVNQEPLIAFDTRYSYQYQSGWSRITGETNVGDAEWIGDNSQFFWFTTYVGVNAQDFVLFVTNFNELEPNFMRYLTNTGTLSVPVYTWTTFRPVVHSDSDRYMIAARILIPFKNRLLAFNVWEGDEDGANAVQYSNRMRYSGPSNASPLATDAWDEDIRGNGNSLDCPTSEAIVTVEFVKDRLIVFLEQSTWEIVFTGNQVAPYAWQQINTELGVESTFSVVPFDKLAIGVGNVGVMACTGANVDRIDDKVPDEVFKIHNSDEGVERVYGIRDFYVEMIYWTFPDPQATASFPYPNKVLIYNYKNGTWAFNDDSITAFGYFQPAPTGILWSSQTVTWDDDQTWDDGTLIALFRQVVAGNQQGWTFIVDADIPINSPALQITDITITTAGSNILTITSVDHNLRQGDYVYFQDITGTGNLTLLNGKIFPVLSDTITTPTPNSFTILYQDSGGSIIAGTYRGGGVMSRVSQIQLLTKQYNFYMEKDRNAYVSKVNFLVDRTENGQIQVDFFVSTADNSMLADSNTVTGTGSLLGSGNLETFPYPTVAFEREASQLWHPYYLQADGEFIQLNIQLNDSQMRNPLIRRSEFQLHSMIFHATPSSQRLQ